MDIKSKGIAWVGNIYQRFETMCHEVDNIVNQDAVKYVENQVQTVGESMKKFCSDVVQVVDPVRCEAQAVALKGNAAVDTYIKSIIGTEDLEHTDPMRQSNLKLSDLDKLNGFDGLNPVNQSTVPASVEFHEGVESDSAGNMDDVITNEDSDLIAEENATNEKSNALEALDLTKYLMTESFSASPSHVLIDSDNENACFSLDEGVPLTSVVVQELETSHKLGNNSYNPSDDLDSVSDISKTVAPSERALSVASSGSSIFTKPHTLPGNSCHGIFEIIESSDNPFNLAAGVQDSSNSLVSSISAPIFSSNNKATKAGFACSNSLLSLELTDSSSSLASSTSAPIASCDKEESETGFTCSNSLISLESTDSSSSLMSSTSAPIFSSNKEEAETGFTCYNSLLALELTASSSSLVSSTSAPIVSSDKEEAETGFTCSNSLLSLESTDRSNSLLSSASTPIFSSNKEEAETRISCSNSAMSLESTGSSNCSTYIMDDIADSGMDTIDLSDKLKLEESCVIVDNSLLYEISRRINRQRSYKKKIQDAFTSKKRLSKEYEQLAIWFGDLDTESSQDVPISTTITVDPDFQIQHSQDSEWELL